MREEPRPEPAPPAVALARRHRASGALVAVLAALSLAFLSPTAAPIAFTLFLASLVFFSFGRTVGRDAWGTAHAAAALQALTRGRFDEAEERHRRVPAHSLRRGTVARSVAVQKALLALFRGSPDGAIAAIGPALEARTGLYTYSVERMQQASGYGVRALAHAMKGDAAQAEADAQAAESYGEALPEAFARARLARAMNVARGGDMVALSAALARDGSLLLEHSMPRERALVRALRKMAHGRGHSVYREPSKPTDGGNAPGALAAWIAQVAPEAAAYAADDVALAPHTDAAKAPEATPAALSAVADARRAATGKVGVVQPRARRVLGGVLVAAACVALAVVTSFGSFAVDVARGGGPEVTTFAVDPFVATFCVGAVAFVAFALWKQILRTRRYNLATIGGQRAAALGDVDTAETLLAQAKNATMPLFAAAAGAASAALAERRTDFARSIEECDLAIAKVGSSHALAEHLLPALLTTRGVALAATGRSAEALAELASIVQKHPGYAHLALADFRIRLVAAVKGGDLVEARRMAMQRTAELPVPLRDDLLAELVLASSERGLPRAEMERLDAELRDDAASRAWVDAIAPGLRERFVGNVHARVRVGPGSEAAEEEAEAIGDLETEARPPARRATLDS